MHCPKCGSVNLETASVCDSCGAALAPNPAGASGQVRTSGAAIASLVLALLGFVTCFLTALPAIICGVIALTGISRSRGQRRGTGLAIAGIVIPLISIMLGLLMAAILLPAFVSANGTAQTVVCANNLRSLAMGLMLYADDNDGALPPPEAWTDSLVRYGVSPESFECPAAPDGLCDYALNRNLTRLTDIRRPARTVLLFECTSGWNRADGPEDVVLRHRRRGVQGCNVAFADGHVEWVPTSRTPSLIWDPRQHE